MADQEVRTRITVEARAKGLDEVGKKATALAESLSPEALTKGLQKLEHFSGQTTRQFRGLEKQVKDLNQILFRFGQTAEAAMDKLDKGFAKAAKSSKKIGDEVDQTAKKLKKMQAAGSFSQGLLQSAGFGPYLQRGPGMARQAAGMAVGGLAKVPFAGIGGLAQGVANIPGVGLLAGPMQAAIQGASQLLEVRELQLKLSAGRNLRGRAGITSGPLTGSERASIAAAGARAFKTAQGLPGSPTMTLEQVAAAPAEAGGFRLGREIGERSTHTRVVPIVNTKDMKARQRLDSGKHLINSLEAQVEAQAGHEAMLRRQRVEQQMFGARDAARIGANMGFNAQATMQRQLAIKHSAGVNAGSGFLKAAFGAERAYDVDAGTSGAFLRAQRQGGMVTGRKSGEDMLADALQDAAGMGKEESEIVDHLATIAQGIHEFQTTGIPVNTQSWSAISRSIMGQANLSSGRAGAIAGGIQKRAAGIGAAGGPSNQLDFLMLQELGGFRGGGMGAYNTALEKMRNKDFTGTQVTNLIRTAVGPSLLGGGGEDEAKFKISRLVSELGGGALSLKEQGLMYKSLAHIPLTRPEQEEHAATEERLRGALGGGPGTKGAAGINEQAALRKDMLGVLKAQANIDNQRLAESTKMIGTLQALEQTQVNAIKLVATFSKEIGATTKFVADLTGVLSDFVQKLHDFFEGGGSGPRAGRVLKR